MSRYRIMFRTCDVVHSVHNAPRPFGLDKRTLIRLCFLSLIEAVRGFEHTIEIVGDKLSDEMMEFFRQFPVTLTNQVLGNDESIRESIRRGLKAQDDEWVYFCEDDYLHTPDAFAVIDDLLSALPGALVHRPKWHVTFGTKLKDRPVVIHTPDYPDRYRHKFRRPSFLFVAPKHHWRQVDMTTFTFMLQACTIKRYRRTLLRAAKGANDKYLSRNLYFGGDSHGPCLCLSPLPGVATHMHEATMTPLVDWQSVADPLLARLREQG